VVSATCPEGKPKGESGNTFWRRNDSRISLSGSLKKPDSPFPLKGDVFSIPSSKLSTRLSTKSGLGKAISALMVSVRRAVQSSSWNRRKPFLKSIPRVAMIIMPAKKAEDPIEVIIIMRKVNHSVPRDWR
jgi:hypothetical protein